MIVRELSRLNRPNQAFVLPVTINPKNIFALLFYRRDGAAGAAVSLSNLAGHGQGAGTA
jgi:hypothetical protein